MKNKFLLLLVAVVLSISYSVAQVVRTVDVTTPGTLATLIAADKLKITDLTVTGTVNASDFAAFKGMTALKNLDLSAMNITDGRIPAYAFQNFNLNALKLPVSVKIIGNNTFDSSTIPQLDFSVCSNLEEIGWSVFIYTNIQNGVIDLSQNLKLTKFHNTSDWNNRGTFSEARAHVILPSNLTRIEARMFAHFKGSVDLPQTIKSIGEFAFYKATPSVELILPNSVETIGTYAFNSSNLTHGLKLPSSLRSVGPCAFSSSTIAKLDFSICNNLEEMSWEVFTYTNIQNGVIDLSKNLKLTKFHNTSNWDNRGTFSEARAHVILPSNLTRIEARMFAHFKATVDLPQTLKIVGDLAFYKSSILSIALPAATQQIGQYAFYSCTSLKEIHSANPVPPVLGINVFQGVDKTTCKLFVPEKSLDLYRAADQWKDFLNIRDLPEFANACLIIQAKDLQSSELLSGGVYRLMGHNFEQLFTMNSSEGIALNNIPLGEYYIIENSAPENYLISKDYTQKIVLCGTDCQTITFLNDKKTKSVALLRTQFQETSTPKSEQNLYPNPVKDVLNIRSDVEVKLVEVYGTNGNLAIKDNSGNSQINVSELAPGMYVVKVHTQEGVQTHKIIKE